jgi:MFS family permease
MYLFAFIFGMALGGDYMIIPLMAAELFGVKVMGRVMGIIISADGLGESIWTHDRRISPQTGVVIMHMDSPLLSYLP